jgi:hypothetical protein
VRPAANPIASAATAVVTPSIVRIPVTPCWVLVRRQSRAIVALPAPAGAYAGAAGAATRNQRRAQVVSAFEPRARRSCTPWQASGHARITGHHAAPVIDA